MGIREQFQDDVDRFIADLTDFASGSYLKDEEKELWDQFFDPAVIPELKALMENFLDALESLGDDPTGEQLEKVVSTFYDALNKYNAKNSDAVLEKEEMNDIASLVFQASAATGADDEALNHLPELD